MWASGSQTIGIDGCVIGWVFESVGQEEEKQRIIALVRVEPEYGNTHADVYLPWRVALWARAGVPGRCGGHLRVERFPKDNPPSAANHQQQPTRARPDALEQQSLGRLELDGNVAGDLGLALKRRDGLVKPATAAIVEDIEMQPGRVSTILAEVWSTHDLSSSQGRCLFPTVVATVECVPVGDVVLDDAVLGPAVCAGRGLGSAHVSTSQV